jgi:hypothetical protein
MATYNGAKYIRQQLDDLAAQTHLPAELVVCDDGSTDGTLHIVEQFATTAPFPVRVHRNAERLGFAGNFIHCAGLCGSELVAFCDQDDRWSHDKLAIVAREFRDPEVLLVHHNANLVSEQDAVLGHLVASRAPRRVTPPLAKQPNLYPLGFTQVLRRSLTSWDDLWPMCVNENDAGKVVAHDRWYPFLASVLGKTVYLPSMLADYRQHGSNVYGVSRFRVHAPKLTELWHATRAARQRAAAADSRSQILEQVATRVSGVWSERALTGARYNRSVKEQFVRRAEIYEAPTVRARMSAVRRLRKMEEYHAEVAPIPALARAMDLMIGVPGLLPVVRRLLAPLSR